MSVPTGALRAGVLLHQKYRLERVLGSGSMGVVWAAQQVANRMRVAIKVLSPGRTHDERTVRRFLREGRATAKLKGEHVARVYDVGRLDDGTPYLVMEYLEGTSLLRHLRSRGPLPPAECAGWVIQACEALGEAHALGIVHRDLKLDNLQLVERLNGSHLLKVLDFGIAKRLSGGATTDAGPSTSWSFDTTGDGSPAGSPSYMAPEQISDPSKVDGRADIWSLGVILYELLSGQRPFDGASLPETISRVLKAPPPPLTQAPPRLAAIVERCLEKDRDLRFQTVGLLAQALAHFASPTASPAAPAAAPSTHRAPHTARGSGAAPTTIRGSAPPPGQVTIGPLVTSQELIYGTQNEQEGQHTLPFPVDAPPPSSQLDTLIAATQRDPPRFDDVTGDGPVINLPATTLPLADGTTATPTGVRSPPAAVRGDELARIQHTARLASNRSHLPSNPSFGSTVPLSSSSSSSTSRSGPTTPPPTPVLILPPPKSIPRKSAPAPKPPRKFDAAITVSIVFVASFASALLTMTMARKCSTAPGSPAAATATAAVSARPVPSAGR